MKKYKKAALSIAFLTLILSGGLSTGYFNSGQGLDKNNRHQEEIILNVFEENDYEAWKKIIAKKSKIHTVISKDDFDDFITARALARSGKYDEAIEISEKLENELKQKINSVVS